MLHMAPICVIVAILAYLMLRYIIYRKLEDEKEDEEIHALRHEIVIWKKTLQSINTLSREEQQVNQYQGIRILVLYSFCKFVHFVNVILN